jgi:hypothetical protein
MLKNRFADDMLSNSTDDISLSSVDDMSSVLFKKQQKTQVLAWVGKPSRLVYFFFIFLQIIKINFLKINEYKIYYILFSKNIKLIDIFFILFYQISFHFHFVLE